MDEVAKPNTEKDKIRYYEEQKNKRVALAQEQGALVVKPEGGEAQIFYYMGRAVDNIFRTSRKQELKLNVIKIKEMQATLEYKKALVTLSDKLKEIAKSLDKEYREEGMIIQYRKDLPDEEATLEIIKSSLEKTQTDVKSKKTK